MKLGDTGIEPVKKIENESGAGVSPAIRRSRKPKNFRRLRAGGGQDARPTHHFFTGSDARATKVMFVSSYERAWKVD
jgi:hypothetical protein